MYIFSAMLNGNQIMRMMIEQVFHVPLWMFVNKKIFFYCSICVSLPCILSLCLYFHSVQRLEMTEAARVSLSEICVC